MASVSRAKAQQVLKAVQKRYGTDEPTLYAWDHEGLEKGSWSIAWEGSGLDYWPTDFRESEAGSKIKGVFLEPIAGWCMGIYPE